MRRKENLPQAQTEIVVCAGHDAVADPGQHGVGNGRAQVEGHAGGVSQRRRRRRHRQADVAGAARHEFGLIRGNFCTNKNRLMSLFPSLNEAIYLFVGIFFPLQNLKSSF
jgi:hypothetical protein